MISTKARHLRKVGETVVIRLTLQKVGDLLCRLKKQRTYVPSPAIERVVYPSAVSKYDLESLHWHSPLGNSSTHFCSKALGVLEQRAVRLLFCFLFHRRFSVDLPHQVIENLIYIDL